MLKNRRNATIRKELAWCEDSKEVLKSFPQEVVTDFGHALRLAQENQPCRNTKRLKSFSAAVYQISLDGPDKCTYRVVYVANIGEYIYVLHCFQKKSTHGIKTPQAHLDKISKRLQKLRRKT